MQGFLASTVGKRSFY